MKTKEERFVEITDALLGVGVSYMNPDWDKFKSSQWHMIKSFRATQGFKEAKRLLNLEVRNIMLEIIGEDEAPNNRPCWACYEDPRCIHEVRDDFREELRKKINNLGKKK